MLASPCRSGGPPIWFFLSLALCPLACHVLCMTKVGIRSSQPGIQPYPRKSKNVLATRSKCPGERSCWHGCLLSWQIPFLPPSLLGMRLGGLDRPRGSIRGQPTCCTWRCWDAQRRVGCWSSQDAVGVLLPCAWFTWPGGGAWPHVQATSA